MVNEIPSIATFNRTNGSFINKYSPDDGELMFKVPKYGKSEIEWLYDESRKSFSNFKDSTVFQRTVILNKIIENLKNSRNVFVNLVAAETGKSRKLSELEFDTGIKFGESLIGLARFIDGISIPSSVTNKEVLYKRVPYGVAGLIVSFNTPLPNYAWKVFPSFLSGNVSILKPSPHTAASAQLFYECFAKDETYPNTLFIAHGDAQTGKMLSELDLDLFSFTGSFEAGIKIQKNIAHLMRKNIFELGGNNCFILTKSADLGRSIDYVLNSAFSNAGQRCAAASRLLIAEEVYSDVIKLLTDKLSLITLGTNDQDLHGPVIDEPSMVKVEKYLEVCKSKGLKVTQFGESKKKIGYFVQPTLVEGFLDNLELTVDEIFAPVLRIIRFSSNNEAISIANNTGYNLTAAVWTSDLNESNYFASKLSSGLININGPTHGSEFQFPFGGIGKSGNGSKEVGLYCLDEYSNHKVITRTYYA
jgi:aldehyde dehydrogenase (NAD+)